MGSSAKLTPLLGVPPPAAAPASPQVLPSWPKRAAPLRSFSCCRRVKCCSANSSRSAGWCLSTSTVKPCSSSVSPAGISMLILPAGRQAPGRRPRRLPGPACGPAAAERARTALEALPAASAALWAPAARLARPAAPGARLLRAAAVAERARPREGWQHLRLLPLPPRPLLSPAPRRPSRPAPAPPRGAAREGVSERAHVTPGNHGNLRRRASRTAAGKVAVLKTLAGGGGLAGDAAPRAPGTGPTQHCPRWPPGAPRRPPVSAPERAGRSAEFHKSVSTANGAELLPSDLPRNFSLHLGSGILFSFGNLVALISVGSVFCLKSSVLLVLFRPRNNTPSL